MVNSIYCSNEKIQVIIGTASKNNINVNSCKDIVLPEGTLLNGVILDSETMKTRLSEELGNTGIQGKDLSLVIDSTSILTKMIKVPNLSKKNVYNIIKLEFETARNKEEFVYDYIVINPKNPEGGSTIFACAVAKSFVESYETLFKSIGYKIVSVDIIQSAVIKIVDNFDLFKNETCTLIINDGNSIVLNLFVDGIYMLSTRYRLVEPIGTRDSINEILGRISVHTQFISSQKLEYKISKIYFCGNYGEDIDISSSLKSVLDIDSSKLDLGDRINSSTNKTIYDYLYSIGNLISVRGRTINLIKQLGINHEKKQEQAKRNLIALPIFGLLIIVLGIYFALFISKLLVENKTETLNSYIADSQNQGKYNEYLNYVQEESTYNSILAELTNLDSMFTWFPDLSSDFFAKIESCANGLITINQMNYSKNEEDSSFSLEITGMSDSVTNIVSFIGNLENNNIEYQNNGYTLADTKYSFSVICKLQPLLVQE